MADKSKLVIPLLALLGTTAVLLARRKKADSGGGGGGGNGGGTDAIKDQLGACWNIIHGCGVEVPGDFLWVYRGGTYYKYEYTQKINTIPGGSLQNGDSLEFTSDGSCTLQQASGTVEIIPGWQTFVWDTDTSPSPSPSPSPTNSAKIIFLHHSTGYNVWQGGVEQWFSNYNTNHGTNYQITHQYFPSGVQGYPWNNYPYDYWNIWINHAGNSAYMGEPTLEMLTQQYDVIVWKHCFPVSDVLADTGNPSISSQTKTIENYKLQYAALKQKMHQFPNTTFIVWTGAARLQSDTNQANAQRAQTFFNWVKSAWDEPNDNIFLWDFRQLETGGGLYLKPEYGMGQYDSHPNATLSSLAAAQFSQRVVDVLSGNVQ